MNRCFLGGMLCFGLMVTQICFADGRNQNSAAEQTFVRSAKQFIELLNTGKTGAAYARLGAKIKVDFSQSRLEQVWPNLNAQLGTFKKIEGSRIEKIGAETAVILTARFAKLRMDIQVVLNQKHVITGFRVRPKMAQKAKTNQRPQIPKPPFTYASREVSYVNSTDGSTAHGTLTYPKESGRHPAVLLVSGSGAQDRDGTTWGHKPFLVIADYLSRRGFVVLRTDDRGRGKSSKQPASIDLKMEVSDAKSGLDFLAQQSDVLPNLIGLIGHSSGGVVASMTASQDKRVAFLGLLSSPGVPGRLLNPQQVKALLTARGKLAAVDVARIVDGQTKLMTIVAEDRGEKAIRDALSTLIDVSVAASKKGPIDEKTRQLRIDTQYGMLTSPWFLSFVRTDPATYLSKMAIPVLVVAGSKDLQVPPKSNVPVIKAALSKANNSAVVVHINQGLNHLLQHAKTGLVREYGQIEETISPTALKQLSDWLQSVTKRK